MVSGRQVCVEESGEGGSVEGIGGGGEVDGEFGVSGGAEGRVSGGAGRDEELGGAEAGEEVGEGEALVEEEPGREEGGTRVAKSGVEEVGLRGVEDKSGDVGVGEREIGGEGASYTGAVGNDLMGGDVAGGVEVLPGVVGVLGHLLLAGVSVGALAVAAVVEGKDVDAEVVQGCEGGGGVGEGAVGAGEEEDGRLRVTGVGGGGDPPAGELWGGGFVEAEVDEFVGGSGDIGGCGGGAGGVKDELPLASVEEEVQGEPCAEEGNEDRNADGFEEPCRIDGLGVAGWFWSGVRHVS